MSREIRQLLSSIVSRYAATDNERRIDLDATAETPGRELEADKAAAVRRVRSDADRQADAFAKGLNRAWERSQRGGTDLVLDDRKPDENAMAEALINFLVRFDLASSHSRDLGGNRYAYVITVNWDRLGDLAAANGQQLEDLFKFRNGAT